MGRSLLDGTNRGGVDALPDVVMLVRRRYVMIEKHQRAYRYFRDADLSVLMRSQ